MAYAEYGRGGDRGVKTKIALVSILVFSVPARAQWVTRDHRWPPRGSWNWSVSRELPQLYREFNGIDFGHAHLAETLLRAKDEEVEAARLEVLDFIFGSPSVPPDEEEIAPTFTRMVWEAQRAFNWAHTFHRSLYDLFSSDRTEDKDAAYRSILAGYLEKPEAITSHQLDHHGKLWSFPESKAFRNKFPRFNTQIWAYHWLQAAAYDVQLMGGTVRQREFFPRVIEHYHGYLRNPPFEWQFMPMFEEVAPDFSARFPEAARVFDNLHMLHDNVDDILCRPDLYPDHKARRQAVLKILPIYLHHNHEPYEIYPEYHRQGKAGHPEKSEEAHEKKDHEAATGPRPPSAKAVLSGGHEDQEAGTRQHDHD